MSEGNLLFLLSAIFSKRKRKNVQISKKHSLLRLNSSVTVCMCLKSRHLNFSHCKGNVKRTDREIHFVSTVSLESTPANLNNSTKVLELLRSSE